MKCTHPETVEVLTPESMHHGKSLCKVCGAFLRWLPNPANKTRFTAISEQKKAILEKNPTHRERDFLESIEKQRFYMTEKQRSWWDSLLEKYGIPNPPSDR